MALIVQERLDIEASITDTSIGILDGKRKGRLVVVSNRVSKPETRQAGGLAQALRSVVSDRGGTWVGWSGNHSEESERVSAEHAGRVDYVTLDIPEAEFEPYYKEYANGVLWPLLHGRTDLIAHSDSARRAYLAVNARFADFLCATISSADFVWIQDYHFIPLGRLLRERGVDARIGFFLHTPFPGLDVLAQMPGHVDLLNDFAAYDLVGVQTTRDRDALRASLLATFADARADGARIVRANGKCVTVDAFPIGVDADLLANDALQADQPAVAALRKNLADRALILGVDRLDYSKGLPERIDAYARLLEESPELLRKLTFLQIAPQSRAEVGDYRRLRRVVQRKVGGINGRFGDESWTPLRYVNRTYGQRELTGFYRLARVGLVTPLRDGMNLVAKEFIACQDGSDPGVLVLSNFAGAARELDAALIVNPLDTAECAAAIRRALAMPLAERIERWTSAMHAVRSNSVHDWSSRFLAVLEDSRDAATNSSIAIAPKPARPPAGNTRSVPVTRSTARRASAAPDSTEICPG